MKKALISSLFPVALLVLSSAASLSATTITIGGTADAASGMTTGVVGATVDTFDDGALPTNYTATNSAAVVSGNSSWVYAAPAGDNTDYLTTGTGSVALTYTNAISYLGFYWGSVDDYNTISLTRTDGTTEAFTGSSLASLGVTANSSQSAYVNFFDESHLGWDKVVLSSTENAFEVDNIATATPEPASMAMLGAGLLALGVIARKRKTNSNV